jgi:phosphoribosylformylglycinamidine synthase
VSCASHCGLDIVNDDISALFNEELGCVIQVSNTNKAAVINALSKAGLAKCIHTIAKINNTDTINIGDFSKQRSVLQQLWSKTSYEIVKLRDNPECAKEEFDAIAQDTLGLQTQLSFDVNQAPATLTHRPKVAILREQGVNGQIEMAAAFDKAGFEAVDVHMSDILQNHRIVSKFDDFIGGFTPQLLQHTALLAEITNINGISVIDFGNGVYALC